MKQHPQNLSAKRDTSLGTCSCILRWPYQQPRVPRRPKRERRAANLRRSRASASLKVNVMAEWRASYSRSSARSYTPCERLISGRGLSVLAFTFPAIAVARRSGRREHSPHFPCGAHQQAWTATTPHLAQSRPVGGLARGWCPICGRASGTAPRNKDGILPFWAANGFVIVDRLGRAANSASSGEPTVEPSARLLG
jgi:hypothetical protein